MSFPDKAAQEFGKPMVSPAMIITLNEEKVEIPQDWTIRDLVQDKGLLNRPIAVEINFELVPQDRFATWTIKGGDTIEIVTLSGGG